MSLVLLQLYYIMERQLSCDVTLPRIDESNNFDTYLPNLSASSNECFKQGEDLGANLDSMIEENEV